MRKTKLSVALVCLLCGALLSISCIGSFSLTNRLLTWNQNIGNKFLNELVFFAFWVLPVYEVCGLADVLVLNSIEFWSGSNPVASGSKVLEGSNGERYLVEWDGSGYNIKGETDGSFVRLDFNEEEQTWSYDINHGAARGVLFTFVDDTHVSLPVDGGREWRTVEISQAGLMAYQQMAGAGVFAAR